MKNQKWISVLLVFGFLSLGQEHATAGTYVGPSAPLNVAQSSTSSGITLSWSAPSSGTPSSYVIERSTNGTTWTSAGTASGSSTSTTIIDGLAGSTSYYFRIAAISASLQGPYAYPWAEVYRTTTLTRNSSGSIVYVSGFGLGASDAASTYVTNSGSTAFSRVRYRIESTINTVSRYADVDFEKWTSASRNTAVGSNWDPSIASLRVPSTSSGDQYVVNANITDMTVNTNSPDVRSGFGISGRLEIWPWNYSTTRGGLTPVGDTSLYDYDDTPSGNGEYGSFQVHTLEDNEPVFVWNRHFNGQNAEVGYGNRATGHPDWTFCADVAGTCTPSSFRLSIFVNPQIATTSSLATNTSLSIAAGALSFRTAKTLTATSTAAGKITFRANNVVLPGCKNLTVNAGNSYTRTCSYRPATRGYVTLTASFTPTVASHLSSTATSDRIFIQQRTGGR